MQHLRVTAVRQKIRVYYPHVSWVDERMWRTPFRATPPNKVNQRIHFGASHVGVHLQIVLAIQEVRYVWPKVDRELQITARSVRTTLPAAEFFPT